MNENIKLFAFADEAAPAMAGQIAAMKRNALNGIEIRNIDGKSLKDVSEKDVREYHRMLDDAGLITWSIGSPIGKIDLFEGDHAAHLDDLKRLLDYAHLLGAENMRMFSFFIPKGTAPETCRNAVMDRMAKLIETAEGSGVALCHENEKGIYGDSEDRCLDLLNTFPQLRGVYDAANFIQCGRDAYAVWSLLKNRIFYMHIKDALPDGTVVPSGKGCGQLQKIVSEYRAQGGYAFTLEPHLTVFDGLKNLEREGERSDIGQWTYPTPDAAFDAAVAALRELL